MLTTALLALLSSAPATPPPCPHRGVEVRFEGQHRPYRAANWWDRRPVGRLFAPDETEAEVVAEPKRWGADVLPANTWDVRQKTWRR